MTDVAQIVYEAMRFDRENYTPPWKNGNSRAEDEARATAARLRAVVLEEAAKKAEKMYRVGQIGSDIAAAIRALKENTND